LHAIAITERALAADALAVEENAVDAAEVLDDRRFLGDHELRVAPRDQAVVEHDVTIGAAPHHHDARAELEGMSLILEPKPYEGSPTVVFGIGFLS